MSKNDKAPESKQEVNAASVPEGQEQRQISAAERLSFLRSEVNTAVNKAFDEAAHMVTSLTIQNQMLEQTNQQLLEQLQQMAAGSRRAPAPSRPAPHPATKRPAKKKG